jgi:hypothetical protein
MANIPSGTSAPTIHKLESTIKTLDALSQDGFSTIFALASMALRLMETEHAYHCPETIAQALTAIRAKAEDIENLINCEAESVGCNYEDPAFKRRLEARCAAKLEGAAS